MISFGPVGPCIWFWPFSASFGAIRLNFWPDLAFYKSCKIHTQGLKLSGKVVLFGPVGLCIWFWPCGPILDQLDPNFGHIWPSTYNNRTFYVKFILRVSN